MKKAVLLLVMLMPLFMLAQTTFEQRWSEYLADCNELVNDTITQTGIVKCKLVPVKMEGKIVSYNQLPTDTVWEKCDCGDYKYYSDNHSNFIWSSGSVGIGTTGTLINDNNTNEYVVRNSEKVNIECDITRDKVCVIKKRKASMEDFLERWLKEKEYIKFN